VLNLDRQTTLFVPGLFLSQIRNLGWGGKSVLDAQIPQTTAVKRNEVRLSVTNVSSTSQERDREETQFGSAYFDGIGDRVRLLLLWTIPSGLPARSTLRIL
jgi:hypothetical protein